MKDYFDKWVDSKYNDLLIQLIQNPEIGCNELENMFHTIKMALIK